MAEKKETDNLENREYRSDVFSMLMEYPENALSVYNALNNSAIEDPSLVEMTTLERGISLTIRNDASFIIGMNLNIYEHQSTYNPNMPLRSLLYFTDIIKSFVKNADIYGRALVMIPRPHFVVFYNGTEKRQEVEVLKNMTIDMTFERRLEIVEKENYEKGKAEGRAEGLLEAYNICIENGMTKEEATRLFGIEQ